MVNAAGTVVHCGAALTWAVLTCRGGDIESELASDSNANGKVAEISTFMCGAAGVAVCNGSSIWWSSCSKCLHTAARTHARCSSRSRSSGWSRGLVRGRCPLGLGQVVIAGVHFLIGSKLVVYNRCCRMNSSNVSRSVAMLVQKVYLWMNLHSARGWATMVRSKMVMMSLRGCVYLYVLCVRCVYFDYRAYSGRPRRQLHVMLFLVDVQYHWLVADALLDRLVVESRDEQEHSALQSKSR
eukprot:6139045-Amphidinium_carterae.2